MKKILVLVGLLIGSLSVMAQTSPSERATGSTKAALESQRDTRSELTINDSKFLENLESGEETIYSIVEELPRFPGCEHLASKQEKEDCAFTKLMEYLASIEYPELAKNNDIEGKVFVSFVIEKDGSVSYVDVPMGADKVLNDAAVAHIEAMPNWVPGRQRGEAVRVQYAVPINFMLTDPLPATKE